MHEEPHLQTYTSPYDGVMIVLLSVITLIVLLSAAYWTWVFFQVRKGKKLPPLPEYRILTKWDVEKARNYYVLQRVDIFNDGYTDTSHIGDRLWAKTNSSHYKCEIVKGEQENE